MTDEPMQDKLTINRRDFISGAVSAAVLISMSAGSSVDAESVGELYKGMQRREVGISEAAFKRARKRAEDLVSKMTLAEKVSQTGTSSPAIPRLKIPAYNYGGEALHGLVRGGPVTSFPLPFALAATWNPALIHTIYTAVSDEARGWNKHDGSGMLFFSPTVLNLDRDPRWGRCEEGLGEDPCLASTIAVQQVRGMQGDNPNYLKTSCCAKHFICNNTEDDRLSVSAPVDDRSFWEYYTRAYQACVEEAGVFNFMGAYSAINGIPCCANEFLLTQLLRDRWGFKGYVVSDCGAIECISENHHYVPTLEQAAALGIQAGCDINCGDAMPAHLANAVALELVSESEIGHAVARVFTARFLLGDFDSPESVPYTSIGFDVCNSKPHQELAVKAARESIVLLKNDRKLLPVDKSILKSVAVIGPTAGFHLGGYSGTPSISISTVAGIAEALGVSLPFTHVWGNELVNSHNVQTQSSSEGGVNVDYIYDGSWVEYPAQDFTGKTSIVIRVSSGASGGTINVHLDSLTSPSIASVQVSSTGDWQKWVDTSAPLNGITGVHKVFFTFAGGGGPLLNVEWFQLRPVTPPTPEPGKPVLVYEPGCSIVGPKDETMFNAAVNAATHADLAILVCGVNQAVDSEGNDRQDIKLTGAQHELIQAVFAANPNTILVLNTNNTLACNWEQENMPAIVYSVFAGQAQGTAIADVIFGNYNPGGKLPSTWYKSIDQLPDFHDYDISKGRTYMYFTGDVIYPFGFGLSYTQFELSDFKVENTSLSPSNSVNVTVKVRNTGSITGSEVVQLYVAVPSTTMKRPVKQLAAFARVELKAGEAKTVTLMLPYNHYSLWFWDEAVRDFNVEPGDFEIHVGTSSADIQYRSTIHLEAATGEYGKPRSLTCTAASPVIS